MTDCPVNQCTPLLQPRIGSEHGMRRRRWLFGAAIFSVAVIGSAILFSIRQRPKRHALLQASHISLNPTSAASNASIPGNVHCCTTDMVSDTPPQPSSARLRSSVKGALDKTRPSAAVYMLLTDQSVQPQVEEVLSRMNSHFLRQHAYPVIVITTYTLPSPIIARLQAVISSTQLEIRKLNALSLHGNVSASTWQLQTLIVPRLLSEDYEWLVRITEDTLVDEDVEIDPVEALEANNKKLGYVAVHEAAPSERSAWDAGREYVLQQKESRSSGNEAPAFDLTAHAPKYLDPRLLIYHRSVFTSHAYEALHNHLSTLASARNPIIAAASSPTPYPSNFTAASPFPSTRITLTLGSLITLPPNAFVQFLHIALVRPPAEPPGLLRSQPPAKTVSKWQDRQLTAQLAPDLQPLFAVREKGWLGADVATSFRFPAHPEASAQETGKYMWLFGDTLIGRSSKDRRLSGSLFIHNSIAFTPAWAAPAFARAEEVEFHWNVSEHGCPTSIFVRRLQENECDPHRDYLWPISGMGVELEDSSRLIILAIRWTYASPGSASVELLSDDIFNFLVLGSTLIVVDNPHDPPQQWSYRQRDLPGTNDAINFYSAIAHEDRKAEVATGLDEMLYLFGVNQTLVQGINGPQAWQYETLARVQVESLLDLSLKGMEVWAVGEELMQEKKWVSWRSRAQKNWSAANLVFPVFSETSVVWSEGLGAYYNVVVDWMGAHILLYLAQELTGPWEKVKVFDIPSPYNNMDLYMAYAGKAHPELARGEEELILTFMTNSPGDFQPLYEAGATDIYVPVFVRVTLSEA